MIRIALITYDISPYRGSEASVSWNFVTKMSRHVHLTVFYGGEEQEIDDYIKQHPFKNIEWVNIPKKDVEHFGRGLRQDYYYSLYYRQWHKETARLVNQKVNAKEIDLIHYLNPIGFKEPGWCWKTKDVPYVWGPVQGVDNRPLKLYRALGLKGTVSALVRRIVHNGLFIFHPRVRKAFHRSNAVFAATPATVKGLKRWHGINATYLPENGITEMERNNPISLGKNQTLNLIWIGGLDVNRKAIGLLFDSLLKIKSKSWHIDILGDGILSACNQAKADKLDERITFHGKVPRSEVQHIFRQSHMHIITSLGEATTTVLWEAMSKSVPTMTLDHCGMAGVVCEKCGIKIPIDSYQKVTDRIAAEIDNIIANPQRIEQLSQGVIECSKNFMWDNRIRIFLNTYQKLISNYKADVDS